MVALDYFPALGPWESPPSLQALRIGREKEQSIIGSTDRGLREDCGGCAQAMKAADLNRFLVICALVPDLYCPGYNPRQLLETNSNLARTSARYKVDSPKIATSVRAELSKSKVNGDARSAQKRTRLKSFASSRSKTIIAQTREATFPSRPLGLFLYHLRFRLCAKLCAQSPDCSPCHHKFSGLFVMNFDHTPGGIFACL
jgi:hypothetical protein